MTRYKFTDATGNGHDFGMLVSADWAVSSGGFPNGDNYLTPDGTINPTFAGAGTDFNLADGTAWTVEVWVYIANNTAVAQTVIGNYELDTTDAAWSIVLGADEKITFSLGKVGGGAYLSVTSAAALNTGTWYHIVGIKQTGGTVDLYINGTLSATSSTTSGTALTPTALFALFLGNNGASNLPAGASSSGMRITKPAIYNAALSSGEIIENYDTGMAA